MYLPAHYTHTPIALESVRQWQLSRFIIFHCISDNYDLSTSTIYNKTENSTVKYHYNDKLFKLVQSFNSSNNSDNYKLKYRVLKGMNNEKQICLILYTEILPP